LVRYGKLKRTAWLLALTCLVGCTSEQTPPVQGVLLITVDTLRADHLGAYGYALPTSPNIDKLAERGVLFRNTNAQWPKTWASMASLHTGRYPKTTGLQLKPRVLPQSLLMLSEVFSEAGYETAAIVANFNVGRTLGFEQGFDHFVESWQERWQDEEGSLAYVNAAGRVKAYTNATLVTDQALKWLNDRDASQPFFLWLHYMDPHGPYLPPQKYAELFVGQHPSHNVPTRRIPTYQQQEKDGQIIEDLAHYHAQYDRQIRYFDDEFGRLVASLEELGLGQSLIALTADHGESLTEHGYYLEHGFNPYQPTAHVPLIIAQPGVISLGRRIDRPVELLDLTPTLVELAGVAIPTSHEGTSFASTLRGETHEVARKPVFTESGYDIDASNLAVRDQNWKLIHVRSESERANFSGAEFELYDLAKDPGELANVAQWNPEEVSRLRGELSRWYNAAEGRDELGAVVDIESLDKDSRDMLKALGYIDADPVQPKSTP
jgi:arylsulfatase A-like enzyme